MAPSEAPLLVASPPARLTATNAPVVRREDDFFEAHCHAFEGARRALRAASFDRRIRGTFRRTPQAPGARGAVGDVGAGCSIRGSERRLGWLL
jgi:hypothetical protein